MSYPAAGRIENNYTRTGVPTSLYPRVSQPKWLHEKRIRPGFELEQFRAFFGPRRLRLIRAIRWLYRTLDRVQTVGKRPIFRRLSPPQLRRAGKPQLYPICSEIAAHCHPSL